MPKFPPYPWRVGDRVWWFSAWHEIIDMDERWCHVVPVGRARGAATRAVLLSCLIPRELPEGTVVRQRLDEWEWRVGREPLVGVWDPQFGTFMVDVLAWPQRCAQCDLFGHAHCTDVLTHACGHRSLLDPRWGRDAIRRSVCPSCSVAPHAPTKGPGEGAAHCAVCGLDRILISRYTGSDSINVHGGPCEPVRACGHRDEIEARWFEGSTWHSGCRECAALHAPEED